jgi:hypothetical protein
MTTKSGFQVSTFPPFLSSPVWPTAPIAPAPKFVIMPTNVRFVPEYNWGCPEDMPDPNCACNWDDDDDDVYDDEALFRAELGAYGASEAQKRRARRKSANLRARAKKQKKPERRKKLLAKAIAVEKKAGIFKPLKKKKPAAGSKKEQPKAKAEEAAEREETEAEALVDSGKVTEPSLPGTEGVPQDAEEGRANMKLIIGGTVALMAAIGIGFAMTQAKKKKAAAALAPAAPVAAAPPPPTPVALATQEGADEEVPPSIANPFRPCVRLLGVRSR